jgi:Ca-activated chloride channel family protein
MVETMTGFTFAPLFGNLALTLIFCAILIAVFVVSAVMYARTSKTSDATVVDWIRRGLITVLLCAAAFGPSFASQTTTQAVNGTDVFFAVDITGSMGVKDAQYGSSSTITRLGAAQKAVTDITGLYPGASYAAVSFGTNASLDVPLTPDARAITTWGDGLKVEPTSVSSGSSLDAPLDTLIRSMEQAQEKHPNNLIVLYLITDGEQTSDSQRRTFSTLRNYVDGGAVIGTGSTQGGTVPLIESSTATQDDSDSQQSVIDPSTKKPAISKLDADTLKDMADETSTTYLHVDSTHTAATLKATISDQYSLLSTNRTRTKLTSLVWPLGIALFILMLWEFGVAFNRQRRYMR